LQNDVINTFCEIRLLALAVCQGRSYCLSNQPHNLAGEPGANFVESNFWLSVLDSGCPSQTHGFAVPDVPTPPLFDPDFSQVDVLVVRYKCVNFGAKMRPGSPDWCSERPDSNWHLPRHSHTHTPTHPHTHPLAHSHTLTNSHTRTRTRSHTRTLTHTHTCPPT
jgi:hypothetical protein